MDAAVLYENISPVCPIIGTTVDHPTDRAQWFYDPKPEATAQEKAAADNVIATIPAEINSRLLTSEFVCALDQCRISQVAAEAHNR